jgi:hypothetical protein
MPILFFFFKIVLAIHGLLIIFSILLGFFSSKCIILKCLLILHPTYSNLLLNFSSEFFILVIALSSSRISIVIISILLWMSSIGLGIVHLVSFC